MPGMLVEHLGAVLQQLGQAAGSRIWTRRSAFSSQGSAFSWNSSGVSLRMYSALNQLSLFMSKMDGRLAQALQVEVLLQLLEGEELALAAGAPAQQHHVVDDRVRQVALLEQILEGGVALALGQLARAGVASMHAGRAEWTSSSTGRRPSRRPRRAGCTWARRTGTRCRA